MLRNRFLRHGYWLMNAEVNFRRKTFNCADMGVADEVSPACNHVSLIIVDDYRIAVFY